MCSCRGGSGSALRSALGSPKLARLEPGLWNSGGYERGNGLPQAETNGQFVRDLPSLCGAETGQSSLLARNPRKSRHYSICTQIGIYK